MNAANIGAVVLSAGMSTRMGNFKPLLPLGKEMVIEHVLGTLKGAGIRDIQIVLGHRAQDVIPVLKKHAVSWVINADYQTEMLSSVKIGTQRLRPDARAFFVIPADIPLVRSQTLYLLMKSICMESPHIIYPTFLGERGHPPLIPRLYTDELMQWRGNGGLQGFLAEYDSMALDVPVLDEGVLMDMDTPDRYQRILARYDKRAIPSKAECRAILASRFSDTHPVVEHGRVVARIGQILGRRLIQAGCKVDVDLIRVCGVLHDIGKGEKDHAAFGADLLKHLGYNQVSEVIASHMNLVFDEGGSITEKEVVYLADKLTRGQNILKLENRLTSKLNQLIENPKGKLAAEKRIRTAMQIEQVIETIIGEKISALVNDGGSDEYQTQ